MSRDGSSMGGLLQYLHADGCAGDTVQMQCQPVVSDDPDGPGQTIEVVVMEWCEECGAADWEAV